MNVILIGYRGTGKSTVAQALGLALGWPWVDADVEIEWRAGKSIASIFADEGEPHFRDLEEQTLAELCRRDRHVVAAGGGAVLREANRLAMQAAGHIVWLRAPVETILERTGRDETTAGRRPNLTSLSGEAEVRNLLAERTPLYEACAELAIDTEGRSPGDIAAEIVERLHLATGSTEDR